MWTVWEQKAAGKFRDISIREQQRHAAGVEAVRMEDMKQTLWENQWQPPNKDFVPLGFARKEPAVKITAAYVVYGGDKPKRIEAPTALMAIEQSGVEHPTRVVKLGTARHYLYGEDGLVDLQPPPAADPAPELEDAAEAAPVETATEPEAEEPAEAEAVDTPPADA